MPRLVFVLCLAEIFGMAGFAAFPALLPTFLSEWQLSNTEAGWISGIYFAGYMVAVPVLVSLTDRVDARRVHMASTLLGGVCFAIYAAFADGFWSALVLWTGAGAGLAGTYMPGLKVLSDNIEGPRQSRFVSYYTASFSIGAGLSYLVAGEVAAAFGWRWAFAAAALGSLASLLLMALFVPSGQDHHLSRPQTGLLDFRPVLRWKPAMAYVYGYAAHMWELFALRSWIVAFLVFSQGLQPAGTTLWSATQAAALVHLVQLPSSIGGNELALRFGRRRVLIAVMLTSALLACVVGFSAALPYWLVVLLCQIYGMTVAGDSASLTAGAVEAAPQGYRGATMAVHSCLGFGMGFLGSVAIGMVLDAAGGPSQFAWGLAFAAMGLGVAMGPVALLILGRHRAPWQTT